MQSTGLLSGKGMVAFWKSVSFELRLADERLKGKIRQKIIDSYLEDQKQKDEIRKEKSKFQLNRFSTPRSFPRQDLNRGDFASPRSGKTNSRNKKTR